MATLQAGTYYKGSEVRFTATFTTLAGVAVDPTAVVLTLHDPAGAVTTPTATKDSTGVYHYDKTLDQSGPWFYRWEGTGAAVVASEGGVEVLVSNF
jgi:hypothetical protein